MSHKPHTETLEHKTKMQHLECHNIYENILGIRTSLSKEEIAETLKELLVKILIKYFTNRRKYNLIHPTREVQIFSRNILRKLTIYPLIA